LRAWLTFVSVILMACSETARESGVTVMMDTFTSSRTKMTGMIDIHHHIVPRIRGDGPRGDRTGKRSAAVSTAEKRSNRRPSQRDFQMIALQDIVLVDGAGAASQDGSIALVYLRPL